MNGTVNLAHRTNRTSGSFMCLAVMLTLAYGCAPAPVPAAQANSTRRPPPIPTDVSVTVTPSLTPSSTIAPSPTPASTAAATRTHTPTSTWTTTPSPDSRPGGTPPRPPTLTPRAGAQSGTPTLVSVPYIAGTPGATPTLPVSDQPVYYTVHLTGVGAHLRQVYELGQQLGRSRENFSKIGDCNTTNAQFLQPFDRGSYALGDYAYLETVITQFGGSFRRIGEAAIYGIHMNTLLDPLWANPNECLSGENSVQCEIRLHQPSIMIIFIQPMLPRNNGWRDLYTASLEEAVELLLSQGVIPVLSTEFDWVGYPAITEDTNLIITQVAEKYAVPLWDLHASTAALPQHGDRGGWHLTISPYSSTDFTDARNLDYAMTIRNLEALQVLHYIMYQVMW